MRASLFARCLGTGVLAATMLAATAAVARQDRTPREPPFKSEGEINFSADAAGFVATGGKTEEEIYVAIPNDELAFQELEGKWHGNLHFQVVLRDTTGDEAYHGASDLTPAAKERIDAQDHSIIQEIRERALLAPGVYRLEISITDQASRKKGLLDRIRHRQNRGKVETWIQVPRFAADSMSVSELVLVRGARVAMDEDAWARRGVDFDPNPTRFYGLALPNVQCFAEVSAGANWQAGDTFLVQLQVMDPAGVPIVDHTSRAEPNTADFGVTDQSGLERKVPAGTFKLALSVVNERTHVIVHTERPFEVVWAVTSWGRDADAVLQEMLLVMTDEEYNRLEKLRPGAREVYLAEFWHGLDPDPTTPDNPTYDEFLKRVEWADHEYSTPMRRGILTDRGRVYVRYGKPDDENFQYSSSNFGGAEGPGEKVAEPGERVDYGTRPATSFLDSNEFQQGDTSDLAAQRGNSTVKSQAVVVWTYDGRGNALRPGHQDLSGESHKGLKFVFADAMGMGDYQLIGSSGTTIY